MALEIDIFYTKDCHNWQTAESLLQQALVDLGLEASFNHWLVKADHQAIEWNVPGSPTFRVNGYDLFPTRQVPAGAQLRSYVTEEGVLDYPTYTMFYQALQAYQ